MVGCPLQMFSDFHRARAGSEGVSNARDQRIGIWSTCSINTLGKMGGWKKAQGYSGDLLFNTAVHT